MRQKDKRRARRIQEQARAAEAQRIKDARAFETPAGLILCPCCAGRDIKPGPFVPGSHAAASALLRAIHGADAGHELPAPFRPVSFVGWYTTNPRGQTIRCNICKIRLAELAPDFD